MSLRKDIDNSADEGFVDASFESNARETQQSINRTKKSPSQENLRKMARALQRLSLELPRVIECYHDEYENNYAHIVAIADEALDAALSVPEEITRTDGGDRSAHALVVRMRGRIKSRIQQFTEST